jgi:hypothetical protein
MERPTKRFFKEKTMNKKSMVIFGLLALVALFAACGQTATPAATPATDFTWDRIGSGGVVITGYVGQSQSVNIPAKIDGKPVTAIGRRAFINKQQLKSVTIPTGVTSIGEEAFVDCASLTSITLPASLTSIAFAAFGECESLTSVTIPKSVTSIGQHAFGMCTNLTSVTFAAGSRIAQNDFNAEAFEGDLPAKYLTGGAGTYTRSGDYPYTWTKR